MKNKEQMGKGFNRMLPDLTAYVIGELKKVWGDQWWSELYNRLYDDQKKFYPENGSEEEILKHIDTSLCLNIINLSWNDVFKKVLYRE